MTKRIFISYRRDDSAGHTGRVFDRLRGEFGQDALFMDVDAIPLGANFVLVLREEVAKCDVLLAIIGPGWLDARDDTGHRRLDNPVDFVRVEIATALQRDIPVIPILLDGTRMPKQMGLPTDLQPLAERNGLDLRHASFHADMDKLVRGLKGAPLAANTADPLVATPTLILTAETVIAAKGSWVKDLNFEPEAKSARDIFTHYFIHVPGGLRGWQAEPGAILTGQRWMSAKIMAFWTVVHGFTGPHSFCTVSFSKVTYLGPTWQPEYAALSKAVFERLGGTPMERFITHP
jgi:TIR domain